MRCAGQSANNVTEALAPRAIVLTTRVEGDAMGRVLLHTSVTLVLALALCFSSTSGAPVGSTSSRSGSSSSNGGEVNLPTAGEGISPLIIIIDKNGKAVEKKHSEPLTPGLLAVVVIVSVIVTLLSLVVIMVAIIHRLGKDRDVQDEELRNAKV